MKVYELAKKHGYDGTVVLSGLKEAGIPVKTPVSRIPEEHLAKAKELFPYLEKHQAGVRDIDDVPPPAKEEPMTPDKLKLRGFDSVAPEGFEARFSQYAVALRKRVIDGKKVFSVLTFAFDPATLDIKFVKEEEKRSEAKAVMDLKYEQQKLGIY